MSEEDLAHPPPLKPSSLCQQYKNPKVNPPFEQNIPSTNKNININNYKKRHSNQTTFIKKSNNNIIN